MNRIIINNKTSLSDMEALDMIKQIIAIGRVSNDGKQYCYGTTFENHMVVTDHVDGRDTFHICEKNGG